MTFSTLAYVFRRVARGRDARLRHQLLSVRQFKRLLARERARSNRSGDRFSLLVFTPSESSDVHETHVRLAKALHRRLRSTDEAGWFDRNRIAVVLPATPPRGAWRLADDVCRLWTHGLAP